MLIKGSCFGIIPICALFFTVWYLQEKNLSASKNEAICIVKYDPILDSTGVEIGLPIERVLRFLRDSASGVKIEYSLKYENQEMSVLLVGPNERGLRKWIESNLRIFLTREERASYYHIAKQCLRLYKMNNCIIDSSDMFLHDFSWTDQEVGQYSSYENSYKLKKNKEAHFSRELRCELLSKECRTLGNDRESFRGESVGLPKNEKKILDNIKCSERKKLVSSKGIVVVAMFISFYLSLIIYLVNWNSKKLI